MKQAAVLICLIGYLIFCASAESQPACDAPEFRRQYDQYRETVLPEWRKTGYKSEWWFLEEPAGGQDTRVLSAEEKPFRVYDKLIRCAADEGDPAAKYFLIMKAAEDVMYGYSPIEVGRLLQLRRQFEGQVQESSGTPENCLFYRYECELGLPESWYAIGLLSACLGDTAAAQKAIEIASAAKVRRARRDARNFDDISATTDRCLLSRAPSAAIFDDLSLEK